MDHLLRSVGVGENVGGEQHAAPDYISRSPTDGRVWPVFPVLKVTYAQYRAKALLAAIIGERFVDMPSRNTNVDSLKPRHDGFPVRDRHPLNEPGVLGAAVRFASGKNAAPPAVSTPHANGDKDGVSNLDDPIRGAPQTVGDFRARSQNRVVRVC